MTVAVLLDGEPGTRPPAEMARLTALVRDAVGYDEKRGDRVTVDTLHFAAAEGEAGGAEGGPVAAAAYSSWMAIGAVLVLVLLVGGGGTGTLMLRRRARVRLAVQETTRQMLEQAKPQPEEMVLLATMDAPIRASTVAALAMMADTRPDDVLAVLRAWIAEETPLS